MGRVRHLAVGRPWFRVSANAIGFIAAFGGLAMAQTVAPMPKLPPQAVAVYPFPGIPAFIPKPSGMEPSGPGGGTAGASTPTGSSGSGSGSSPNVMSTLVNQSWGVSAINGAMGIGLNPAALAATCVIESGCGVNTGDGSGAQGDFQMFPAAYQAGLQAALAADPALASEIVPGAAGMNDPLTESIAASGYLSLGATDLMNNGVSDPSFTDVRGWYNFGPKYGISLAQAQNSDTMSSVLAGYSATTLAKNGITPGETVGQWRVSIENKVGSAASDSVIAK